MSFAFGKRAETETRLVIRQTWASIGNSSNSSVKVGFLLGAAQNEKEQLVVESESSQFEDIIQENFNDTYRNLTLKTIMALRWASTYCPNAQWVVKADSDVYVNVAHLWSYLKTLRNRSHDEQQEGLLIGKIARGEPPHRSASSKWHASEQQYPMQVYPPYAYGPCYVMSGNLTALLYAMSLRTPFFHLEDVFVGLCFKKLMQRVQMINNGEFQKLNVPETASDYGGVYCAHKVAPNSMKNIWSQMTRNATALTGNFR